MENKEIRYFCDSHFQEIVNDLVDQLRNRTNGFETTPMLKKVTEFFGGSEYVLQKNFTFYLDLGSC